MYDDKIQLPDEIIEWKVIKNQDKDYIDRLRKQNETLRYFKVMRSNPRKGRKTKGMYYKLYAHKKIGLEQRLLLVDLILKRKTKCGLCVEEYVSFFRKNSNDIKRTSDNLFDRETILLSNLGEYILQYTNNANILSHKQSVKVGEKEVATFGDYIKSTSCGGYHINGEKSNAWTIDVTTKDRMDKFKDRFNSKMKKWDNSKTARQNLIYSYNNNRDDEFAWSREGLISKSKPYISEWCIVDTENIFEFQGNRYEISKDVGQYSIRKKKPRYDDYKSDYQMDQILVYEQEGKLFFFDQNIEQIENDKIIKL